MKNIILVIITIFAVACQQEEIQTQVVTGSGCEATIARNIGQHGKTVTVIAELTGCIETAVFQIETQNEDGSIISSYRKSLDCDRTEETISFALGGRILYAGVYPCGSTSSGSGRSYTLTIIQDGQEQVFNTKVGTVNNYIVK